MDFPSSLVAAAAKLQLPSSFQWKSKQVECLEAIYEGKDLLAVLPTGYGKSIIFQAVPYIIACRDGLDINANDKIVIVITPLNSIMEDQCRQLTAKGISACYLDFKCQSAYQYQDIEDEDAEETISIETVTPLKDIEDRKFNIIYAHPESLLCEQGRSLIRTIRSDVCAIAIDEAHIVLEWGAAFRKDFARLGEELIPLFTKTPILLFTATAPPLKQDELLKSVNVQNPCKILMNPDRTNIKYESIERPPSTETQDHLDTILKEIGKELKELMSNYPITIVYTDTSVISYCYWYMERFLGECQYDGEPVPENRLFAQYHKEYTEKLKKFIVSEICKKDSKIRLVFATVALGMGLNAPSIRHVIHYKPPTSLEKYFQETGRAGRDGLPSKSTLYYNNSDIRSNRPGITSEIINYCRNNDKCRRVIMLAYFGYQPSQVNSANCWDVCDSTKKEGS